jgi:uncharacterized protein YegP (UPF0339 family)
MRGQFELYTDEAGEWRWHFRADNGNIVFATSEGYKNKEDAIAVMPSLQSQPKRWIEL